MKIRTDFVTNSSSSSYVTIIIESKTLKNITEKYIDLLKAGWSDIRADKGLYISEAGHSVSVPTTEVDLVDALAEVFYDGYDQFIEELKANEQAIIADVKKMEFTCVNYGWQGDSDSRYYKGSYSEETLQEIYEAIMENNGYDSPEEVTDDDFADYVADGTSIETDTFLFNRRAKEPRANYHSFELEFY